MSNNTEFKFNFKIPDNDILQFKNMENFNIIKNDIENKKEIIVDNQININYINACENGDYDTVVKLCTTYNYLINYKTKKNKSGLIYASKYGHFDIVKYLVENGADLNIQDINENTALMYGVYNSRKVAEYLITQGSNLDIVNNRKCNCLHISSSIGNLVITDILYNQGMNLEDIDINGNTPIFVALLNKQYNIVKYLLKKNININLTNNNIENNTKSTLLHICIYYDISEEIVNLLIKNNININAVNENNETPLKYACKLNKLEYVKLLLSKGANPNINSYLNYSCLHDAIDHNNYEMLKILINYNCNYNIKTLSCSLMAIHTKEPDYNESVLTYAMRYSNTNIINYLKSKNAIYYKCY